MSFCDKSDWNEITAAGQHLDSYPGEAANWVRLYRWAYIHASAAHVSVRINENRHFNTLWVVCDNSVWVKPIKLCHLKHPSGWRMGLRQSNTPGLLLSFLFYLSRHWKGGVLNTVTSKQEVLWFGSGLRVFLCGICMFSSQRPKTWPARGWEISTYFSCPKWLLQGTVIPLVDHSFYIYAYNSLL